MNKLKVVTGVLLAVLLAVALVGPAAANGPIDPLVVEAELEPGEEMMVEKTVTTPLVPPLVDVCLLEDETGSFWDDIDNLQGGTTASDIYDAIIAESPEAQFAVAGFRDYPIAPYGGGGDWVFRLLSDISPVKAHWLNGIAALTAGGGADTPEAQYDAIVAATTAVSWRPDTERVLVVATDAPFHHGPDGTHVNDHASTVAALAAENIIVIGLKAPGAGGELDALAAATGGSVQPLSPSGDDIAEAILAGLEELTTDVWWTVDADEGLKVTLDPEKYEAQVGGTELVFNEYISVDPCVVPCSTLTATVTFWGNTWPEEGAEIGVQEISIHVVPVPVEIDIKPMSFPNSINPKSNGVVPVAILGSADFDVTTVDPMTLAFGPDGATPAHDLSDPAVYVDHLHDANGDGFIDLVSHYHQKETGLEPGDTEACLTGQFFDCRHFEGCDSVRILGH
jgi:hypothetical protein